MKGKSLKVRYAKYSLVIIHFTTLFILYLFYLFFLEKSRLIYEWPSKVVDLGLYR